LVCGTSGWPVSGVGDLVTSLFTVRKAIKERVESLGDVTFYWSMPTYPEAPAVLVAPDFPPADMEQAFNSSYTTWNLMLTLIVDRIDEDAAQEQLSKWIDPDGPFISALRSDDIDDTLGKLTQDVRVLTVGDFNEMNFDGTMFYYTQIRVKVRA